MFCAAATESPVKYALIQGSSRGIGLQVVTQLLERPDYRFVPPKVRSAARCTPATQFEFRGRAHRDRLGSVAPPIPSLRQLILYNSLLSKPTAES